MHKPKSVPGVLRRVITFASGATLLQVSSCAIDESTLTEFADLFAQALLTALTGST